MNRACCFLAMAGILLTSLAVGQTDRPSPAAGDLVEGLRKDLRDARRLLSRVGNPNVRQKLEVLLSRASLKAEDLEELLGKVPREHVLRPITDAEFSKLLKNMKDRPFDKDKVTFVENFVRERPITCEQATRVVEALAFKDGRVKAAVALYPTVVDPENFFEVLKVFPFESTRKEVMETVRKNKRRRE